jgi:hypothetical protein
MSNNHDSINSNFLNNLNNNNPSTYLNRTPLSTKKLNEINNFNNKIKTATPLNDSKPQLQNNFNNNNNINSINNKNFHNQKMNLNMENPNNIYNLIENNNNMDSHSSGDEVELETFNPIFNNNQMQRFSIDVNSKHYQQKEEENDDNDNLEDDFDSFFNKNCEIVHKEYNQHYSDINDNNNYELKNYEIAEIPEKEIIPEEGNDVDSDLGYPDKKDKELVEKAFNFLDNEHLLYINEIEIEQMNTFMKDNRLDFVDYDNDDYFA